MSDVMYPDITVKMVGMDGNAFAILARVRNALRRAKIRDKYIQKFTDEAMKGDYDNLLQTCMKWVSVE
ncbi:MAG: hypothetical protein IH948_10065 [Bacteroidetes bacterium]|nr:hypothetical protein [Bacteroidota bacterium]